MSFRDHSLVPLKCILGVEDDPLHGRLLKTVIQQETPYFAFFVSTGPEALHFVQSVMPDLFLLDYALPGMNGLEVHQRLTTQPGLERIPAILLTACPFQAEVRASPLPCLAKPYDLDTLLKALNHLLAGS